MNRLMLIGLVAVLGLEISAGAVRGQSGRREGPTDLIQPRSDVGGNANRELRNIYRSSIGYGFDVNSINNRALQRTRATVPNLGQQSTNAGRQRLNLGISSSSQEKPFANARNRPSVSPYLNLFREDTFGGVDDFNYQTLVRPQLQQQRINEQAQAQSQALSQQVQQLSARPAFNPRGSVNQVPTGHQTVFGFYGRFYPSMNARRR